MRLALSSALALRHEGHRSFGRMEWIEGERLRFRTHALVEAGDRLELQVELPGAYDTAWGEVEVLSATRAAPGDPLLCTARLVYLPQADRARLDRWLDEQHRRHGEEDRRPDSALHVAPRPVPVDELEDYGPVDSANSLVGGEVSIHTDSQLTRDCANPDEWPTEELSMDMVGRTPPDRGGRAAIVGALRKSLRQMAGRRDSLAGAAALSATLSRDGSAVSLSWNSWEDFSRDWLRQLRFGRLVVLIDRPAPPSGYRLTVQARLPDGAQVALLSRVQQVDGQLAELEVELSPAMRQRVRRATLGV